MRYLTRLIPVLALLLAATLFSTPARAQEHEVRIDDFSFAPSNLTVNVGDTVTWVNYDVGIPHNAHATDDTFETEVVEGSADGTVSGSYTFTADDVGTHEYICDVHPNMRGTITVMAAAEEPAEDEDEQQEDEQQDDEQQPEMPDTGAGGMAGDGTPLWWVAALVALLATSAGIGLRVLRRAGR